MRRRDLLRLMGQAGIVVAGGYLFGCAAPGQQAQQGGTSQGQGAGAPAGGSGPLLSAEITALTPGLRAQSGPPQNSVALNHGSP